MPKVYSAIEVRSKTWGIMVGALTFFVSLSMILGILWPIERTKRKDAEEARGRLTIHAHRLAQAKVELEKELTAEKESKETILVLLKQTQEQVASLQNQLTAQAEQLKIIQEASAKPVQPVIEILSKQRAGKVELGKVVVGSEPNSK